MSWFSFLVVCSFLVQCTIVDTVQNRGEEAAGRQCRCVSCVSAHFPPSTVSCFWGSRSSFTQITWVQLWWQLTLHSWCLIYRKGVALKGWIPDSSDTDIMIFVLSQQAAASAFSGSSRACNLIFLGKSPLCGLGSVGAPAELCNGILSFCSILECDEILTCPSDYILLTHIWALKKKKLNFAWVTPWLP